jgi:hypothetical protein
VAEIGRIATNVGFAAFILEVDLRLVEWCMKQVVGLTPDGRTRRRADAEPVEPQSIATSDPIVRIKRQKLPQCLFLASIKRVTLKLGDRRRFREPALRC